MGLFRNDKLTRGKATSKQLYKGFCIHAAVKNHPLYLVLGILPSHSLASTSFLLLRVWLLSMGPHCHFLRQHFGKVLFKKHCRKVAIRVHFSNCEAWLPTCWYMREENRNRLQNI